MAGYVSSGLVGPGVAALETGIALTDAGQATVAPQGSKADVPGWARQLGERPRVGESGKDLAEDRWTASMAEVGRKDTGPGAACSAIKTWEDRSFEDPK